MLARLHDAVQNRRMSTSTSRRVGYIGLGNLGEHIAMNLVRAGHEVAVCAVPVAAMVPVVQAVAAGIPCALALGCGHTRVCLRCGQQPAQARLWGAWADVPCRQLRPL